MDYQILYDAIFKRRSIRKYDDMPITEEALSKLQQFLDEAMPLIPEIKTEFKVVEKSKIKSNAPQCLCLYSEKKENYRMNAGFLMEQADLYLSANNIGACWLGMAKPNKDSVPAPEGMEWVATLCFGTPAQPLHRSSTDQFKRKSLNEISDVTDLYHVLEAVRLAPSAVNKQPWFFSGTAEQLIVGRKKSVLLNKISNIDIGIALCCLWLSLKHQNKEVEISFEHQSVPEKHAYAATVKISE